tara:strand:- start:52 stop:273 length:222 start_codon:yes stop_codon:yes gene_type:complete
MKKISDLVFTNNTRRYISKFNYKVGFSHIRSWFSKALVYSNVKAKIDHLYCEVSIISQAGLSNFLNKRYFKKT